MWLEIVALLVTTVVVLLISRKVFGTYLSPVALYFVIWMLTFSLYLARLILYESVSSATWVIMLLSLFAFGVGVITSVLAHNGVRRNQCYVSRFSCYVKRNSRTIIKWIQFLSLVGLIPVLGEWFLILKDFGDFRALYARAGEIRTLFVLNKLDFGVFSYLIMFAYVGAVLGGVIFAICSFRNISAYLPMLSIVLFALPITARLNILWGLLLYFNAYVLGRLACGKVIIRARLRNVTRTFVLGLLVFAACNALWLARTGKGEYPLYERYAHPKFVDIKKNLIAATGNLEVANLLWGNLISNYAYATSTFAKLNAFLDSEMLKNNDFSPAWGTYSFAAVFRLLAKIGIRVRDDLSGQVEQLMTPVPAKPGTYLNQAIYDFGWFGAILLPYLLGGLSTTLYLRFLNKPNFTALGVLSVLYLVIEYSWHSSLFIHTVPFGVLLLLLLIGAVLDRKMLRLQATEARTNSGEVRWGHKCNENCG